MKPISVLAAAALVLGLVMGCEDKAGTPTQEPAVTGTGRTPDAGAVVGRPATTTATAPTAAAPVVRDEDIPTLADYEEAAEKEITPANMEAELAKIEKELTTAGAGQTEGGARPGQQGAAPGTATQPGQGTAPGKR